MSTVALAPVDPFDSSSTRSSERSPSAAAVEPIRTVKEASPQLASSAGECPRPARAAGDAKLSSSRNSVSATSPPSDNRFPEPFPFDETPRGAGGLKATRATVGSRAGDARSNNEVHRSFVPRLPSDERVPPTSNRASLQHDIIYPPSRLKRPLAPRDTRSKMNSRELPTIESIASVSPEHVLPCVSARLREVSIDCERLTDHPKGELGKAAVPQRNLAEIFINSAAPRSYAPFRFDICDSTGNNESELRQQRRNRLNILSKGRSQETLPTPGTHRQPAAIPTSREGLIATPFLTGGPKRNSAVVLRQRDFRDTLVADECAVPTFSDLDGLTTSQSTKQLSAWVSQNVRRSYHCEEGDFSRLRSTDIVGQSALSTKRNGRDVDVLWGGRRGVHGAQRRLPDDAVVATSAARVEDASRGIKEVQKLTTPVSSAGSRRGTLPPQKSRSLNVASETRMSPRSGMLERSGPDRSRCPQENVPPQRRSKLSDEPKFSERSKAGEFRQRPHVSTCAGTSSKDLGVSLFRPGYLEAVAAGAKRVTRATDRAWQPSLTASTGGVSASKNSVSGSSREGRVVVRTGEEPNRRFSPRWRPSLTVGSMHIPKKFQQSQRREHYRPQENPELPQPQRNRPSDQKEQPESAASGNSGAPRTSKEHKRAPFSSATSPSAVSRSVRCVPTRTSRFMREAPKTPDAAAAAVIVPERRSIRDSRSKQAALVPTDASTAVATAPLQSGSSAPQQSSYSGAAHEPDDREAPSIVEADPAPRLDAGAERVVSESMRRSRSARFSRRIHSANTAPSTLTNSVPRRNTGRSQSHSLMIRPVGRNVAIRTLEAQLVHAQPLHLSLPLPPSDACASSLHSHLLSRLERGGTGTRPRSRRKDVLLRRTLERANSRQPLTSNSSGRRALESDGVTTSASAGCASISPSSFGGGSGSVSSGFGRVDPESRTPRSRRVLREVNRQSLSDRLNHSASGSSCSNHSGRSSGLPPCGPDTIRNEVERTSVGTSGEVDRNELERSANQQRLPTHRSENIQSFFSQTAPPERSSLHHNGTSSSISQGRGRDTIDTNGALRQAMRQEHNSSRRVTHEDTYSPVMQILDSFFGIAFHIPGLRGSERRVASVDGAFDRQSRTAEPAGAPRNCSKSKRRPFRVAWPTVFFDANRRGTLEPENCRCSICLEEFKHMDKQTFLPCLHCFHRQCIAKWFKRSAVCPICLLDMRKLFHFAAKAAERAGVSKTIAAVLTSERLLGRQGRGAGCGAWRSQSQRRPLSVSSVGDTQSTEHSCGVDPCTAEGTRPAAIGAQGRDLPRCVLTESPPVSTSPVPQTLAQIPVLESTTPPLPAVSAAAVPPMHASQTPCLNAGIRGLAVRSNGCITGLGTPGSSGTSGVGVGVVSGVTTHYNPATSSPLTGVDYPSSQRSTQRRTRISARDFSLSGSATVRSRPPDVSLAELHSDQREQNGFVRTRGGVTQRSLSTAVTQRSLSTAPLTYRGGYATLPWVTSGVSG